VFDRIAARFCNRRIMEDATPGKKWLALVVTAASLIGIMALFGYLSIRFLPAGGAEPDPRPTSHQASPAPAVRNAPTDWTDDTGAAVMQPVRKKYILHKDIRKQIGRSLVTYRGKSSGHKIKLDVVVLDLDPKVTYSRTIDISRAKRSFHIGDERYELISAGSLRLRIWHYPF
jgi:hypothetical protein